MIVNHVDPKTAKSRLSFASHLGTDGGKFCFELGDRLFGAAVLFLRLQESAILDALQIGQQPQPIAFDGREDDGALTGDRLQFTQFYLEAIALCLGGDKVLVSNSALDTAEVSVTPLGHNAERIADSAVEPGVLA